MKWDEVEHLLAQAVDHLAAANWQRGGGKGPQPKPLERPGGTSEGAGRKQYGSVLMTSEELHDWLGWGDRSARN